MKKRLCLLLILGILSILPARSALAWGPHGKITQAALEVLPELERWNRLLGEENVKALAAYCLLPDQRGRDLGAFYADDYLLIRAMPRHAGHVMPGVQETFEPYFRRALQAFRTEDSVNACRQLGPLVHFVEDVGAPPHAKANCPHHTELENWVNADQITIRGYQPRLLGKTDEEALRGMLARIADLVDFSTKRADRALPLVSAPNPDRAQVEPILLESALESARLTADVIYTVFTLGLAPEAEGAWLSGTVTAAELPGNNDHGARIVLLDTDYCTLAITAATASPAAAWQGVYEFHHLPPGRYRVLAYRVGSQAKISEPVTLEAGKRAKVDFSLPAAEPEGNLVDNPDAAVCVLQKDLPDHWTVSETKEGRVWTSSAVRTRPDASYRCGAALKAPKVRVCFELQGATAKKGEKIEPIRAVLEAGKAAPPELHLKADDRHPTMIVRIETPLACRTLGEAIQRVWIVAETSPPLLSLQHEGASLTPCALPPASFHNVACEGFYQHHLQGICVDEEAIYWSFTTMLVKTDLDGKLLKKVPVANHHGDLCFQDGKLYVAVNLGKFNDPKGNADSWVYVYDSSELALTAKHAVQEVFHGAGGIGFRDGHFFVVGGLPDGVEKNYVYEYDEGFRFIKKHVVKSGHTQLGIQTASFALGRWWFGCYGEPKILLVTDAEFRIEGRYQFDCSLGIAGLPDGRFLVAGGRTEKGKGCTGSVKLATADAKAGLRFVD